MNLAVFHKEKQDVDECSYFCLEADGRTFVVLSYPGLLLVALP